MEDEITNIVVEIVFRSADLRLGDVYLKTVRTVIYAEKAVRAV